MEDNYMRENEVVSGETGFNNVPEDQKKGLGIASMILGGCSILCCSCPGLGFLLAVLGGIFSIVCLVKGTGSGKTFGIVGIILNAIGVLLGIYMLVTVAMMFNWENFTMENLNKINEIDPNDEEAINDWLRQFFRAGVYY